MSVTRMASGSSALGPAAAMAGGAVVRYSIAPWSGATGSNGRARSTHDHVACSVKPDDYYRHARPEIAALVPVDARRVLDVGCAEGIFGGELKRSREGLEIWGIEPVPEAAEAAQSRLDRVIAGAVETALDKLPDAHFDCVTFNDSLEHLVDPWVVLRAMRTKLRGQGRVVASIPNLRHYPVMKSLFWRGDFNYAPEGVLDRTHLRFFTRTSMLELFGACGYKVTHTEGLRPHPLPPWLALASSLRNDKFEDMRFMQYAVVAAPDTRG